MKLPSVQMRIKTVDEIEYLCSYHVNSNLERKVHTYSIHEIDIKKCFKKDNVYWSLS